MQNFTFKTYISLHTQCPLSIVYADKTKKVTYELSNVHIDRITLKHGNIKKVNRGKNINSKTCTKEQKNGNTKDIPWRLLHHYDMNKTCTGIEE